MGLSAVQELARILRGMRARGIRSAWLSDSNISALATPLGRYSAQKSQPEKSDSLSPSHGATRNSAISQGKAVSSSPIIPVAAKIAPAPPSVPEPARKASVPELPADFGRSIAAMSCEQLDETMRNCRYCGYCAKCQNKMLHVGVRKPKILFIGDYPSEAECAGASPFSTPAGEMLFKMGTAMGLAWENAPQGRGVAFVNVLKCRPETMTPTAESLSVCGLYLRRQIELAEPAALVLLGHLPVKVLSIMGNASFSSIEGKILDCRGIVAMPIKHPNAIMRFVNQKSIFFDERKKAWTALQQLMKMVF